MERSRTVSSRKPGPTNISHAFVQSYIKMKDLSLENQDQKKKLEGGFTYTTQLIKDFKSYKLKLVMQCQGLESIWGLTYMF